MRCAFLNIITLNLLTFNFESFAQLCLVKSFEVVFLPSKNKKVGSIFMKIETKQFKEIFFKLFMFK